MHFLYMEYSQQTEFNTFLISVISPHRIYYNIGHGVTSQLQYHFYDNDCRMSLVKATQSLSDRPFYDREKSIHGHPFLYLFHRVYNINEYPGCLLRFSSRTSFCLFHSAKRNSFYHACRKYADKLGGIHTGGFIMPNSPLHVYIFWNLQGKTAVTISRSCCNRGVCPSALFCLSLSAPHKIL